MKFQVFEVGKVYEPAIGMSEGVRFDLTSSGGILLYGFNNPTAHEVEQMKAGKHFEIRYTEMNGILWITSKCGDLAWTDAPYNPRLSSGLPDIDFEEGEGIALSLVMIDVPSGIVKSARLIGLGTRFSRYLTEKAIEVREQPMTIMEANRSINATMAMCSSEDLAKVAPSQARFEV